MNVPYIASLCLIIASVAISNLTVTHVTAGDLFSDTSPSVTPHNPIPGFDIDSYGYIPVFISNYDEHGYQIKKPESKVLFPEHERSYEAYELYQRHPEEGA